MDYKTADELAAALRRQDDVRDSAVVYFKNKGDQIPSKEGINEEIHPDENYGVRFDGNDMLIQESVIQVVSKYSTGGIITHPDNGIVCPSTE